MAARLGFEPATLLTEGIELTTELPRLCAFIHVLLYLLKDIVLLYLRTLSYYTLGHVLLYLRTLSYFSLGHVLLYLRTLSYFTLGQCLTLISLYCLSASHCLHNIASLCSLHTTIGPVGYIDQSAAYVSCASMSDQGLL